MQLENKFSVRPTSSAAAATIEALRQQSDACTQKVTPKAALVANAMHDGRLAIHLHQCITEAGPTFSGVHPSCCTGPTSMYMPSYLS